MGLWLALLGTVRTTFKIGLNKAVLDPSANTSQRTYTLPDRAGTFALLSGRNTFSEQYGSGPIHDNGNSGSGTVTIDWDNGNSQLLTLTGSPTLAFSNGQSGFRYLLEIRTGAGSFTVTWPTVTWMRSGGTAPTVPTAASKTALVGLSYNGTTYIGSYGDNA